MRRCSRRTLPGGTSSTTRPSARPTRGPPGWASRGGWSSPTTRARAAGGSRAPGRRRPGPRWPSRRPSPSRPRGRRGCRSWPASRSPRRSRPRRGWPPSLKWPNDVLLPDDGDRKVCGVLCEVMSGPGESVVVVGAGHQRRPGPRRPPRRHGHVPGARGGDVGRPEPARRRIPLPPLELVCGADRRPDAARLRDAYRERCGTVGPDRHAQPAGPVRTSSAPRRRSTTTVGWSSTGRTGGTRGRPATSPTSVR